MRIKVSLAIGFFFAVLSFGLVEFNTYFVSKKLADSAYATNTRIVALLAHALGGKIEDSFFSAGLMLSNPANPEHINRSHSLLSAMTLDWKGAEFTYSVRIDNSDFLRTRGLTGAALSKVVEELRNDIVNNGAAQEQVYAAQIDGDIPVLVFIRPTATQSTLVVVQAKDLLEQLKDSANTLVFVVDRFGTILLHPEQERATHRESALQNPTLKRLFLSAADHDSFRVKNGQVKDAFGFFSRMPFAGMAVISQLPATDVLAPIGTLRFTLAMAALMTVCATFVAFYAIEVKRGAGADESDLKTAA